MLSVGRHYIRMFSSLLQLLEFFHVSQILACHDQCCFWRLCRENLFDRDSTGETFSDFCCNVHLFEMYGKAIFEVIFWMNVRFDDDVLEIHLTCLKPYRKEGGPNIWCRCSKRLGKEKDRNVKTRVMFRRSHLMTEYQNKEGVKSS